MKHLRLDHKVICDMVTPGAKVLDMGSGEGDLLAYLVEQKDVDGTGVEINEEAIYKCVEKGLSVFHGDIDSGLSDYPDKFFDFVIFNQAMQQVHKPLPAIKEALRIGKKLIIGFPNFCNINARLQLCFLGRVPVTPSLPYTWYDTPNLHFLSIRDFQDFCRKQNIKIEKSVFLGESGVVKMFPNLFALNGIFQVSNE
ncbi:MAG: methionine biosynthesis protein MetW [Candidatus Omnitrophica bacterium]|nr:methionine biosynthesis protein MetW [Candidatus Omnitrophota bacterium]